MEEITQAPDTSILDSFQQYTDASKGSRFLNFLIDNILMAFGLGLLTWYLLSELLFAVAPDFLYYLFENGEDSSRVLIADMILAYFNYIVYYIFCETAFKGYTLGKLITGTRAIRNDGGKLTLKDATLRTLSRLVPFEVFSGFGDAPWHDSWTKTRVVKAR